MKRIITSIIYSLIFFPQLTAAQIKSSSSGLERPSIFTAFTSVSMFLYVILGGIGALSIVGIFIAAIDYLVAGGDEERVGRSGRTLAFSLVGLLIAFLGILIINFAKSTITQ